MGVKVLNCTFVLIPKLEKKRKKIHEQSRNPHLKKAQNQGNDEFVIQKSRETENTS